MKETEITICMADISDAEAVQKIYEPYVKNTAITFEYETPTVEEFRNRISRTLKRYPFLVAKRQGEIVGYTYAGPFKTRKAYDWAVEVSVYVDRNLKRMGIGSQLYSALETILKCQNILNINACIAYPPGENQYLSMDSVLFHERMGYEMCGRFHQCGYKFYHWYDIMIFSKGKARNMRLDKKKTDKTGEVHYMSGCNGMLPTMFDVQPVSKKNRIHQSELPVELCEEILEYVTYEGEIVLDSFAGSGAVGVAALNKKRSCILIEILKENIEKIRTRFNSVLYQTVLE